MPTYTLIQNRITNRHVSYPAGIKPAGSYIDGEHPLGKYWNGQSLQDDLPLTKQKSALKDQNLQRRLDRMAQGISYDFPDGTGTVQTRNDTDLGNINAVATTAIVLQGQGVTDPVVKFRDTENVTHLMTPEQAIAFGVALSSSITAIYQNKWDTDEAIDALADQAAIDAFDLDAEWSGV